VEKVLTKAAAKSVPIRIGVNGGSLPQDLRQHVEAGTLDRAEALVQAAERELAVFKEFDFTGVLVSMKASSAGETIRANRLLAERTRVPLHIGVTEAGPLIAGVTRNAVALYALLSEGIGDTIRVSLSDTMENEVIAGREILNLVSDSADVLNRDTVQSQCAASEGDTRYQRYVSNGVTIVSCPRCGRNGFDTHGFTARWLDHLYTLKKKCTIAIMGCAVNGPEEARHADLGITGAGNKVLLFRHGKISRTIDASGGDLSAAADRAFREELDNV
jgi:(E)-4-hydroxy-3-methylbut-2-enyl-diphosphate synthase